MVDHLMCLKFDVKAYHYYRKLDKKKNQYCSSITYVTHAKGKKSS